MSEEWKDDSGGDDVQVPLGAGDGTGMEAGFTDGARAKINTSTLALFAAFAAALVVLYLLGLQNKPRSVSAQQQTIDIESKIDELIRTKDASQLGAMLKKNRELVDKFYTYFESTKPAIDPKVNPFAESRRAVVFDPSIGAPTMDLDKQERLRRLAVEFSVLKLQTTIVHTGRGAAMINGSVVPQGGRIGNFTVRDVQQNRVILDAEGGPYELKIAEKPAVK